MTNKMHGVPFHSLTCLNKISTINMYFPFKVTLQSLLLSEFITFSGFLLIVPINLPTGKHIKSNNE